MGQGGRGGRRRRARRARRDVLPLGLTDDARGAGGGGAMQAGLRGPSTTNDGGSTGAGAGR